MDQYWEIKEPLANEENQKVINEFLLCQKNANKSKETVREYRNRLESFFKEWEGLYAVMTTGEIRQWLSEKKVECKETGYKSYLRSLRSFYKFCVREGYVETSPINARRNESIMYVYWELSESILKEENAKILNAYLLSLKKAGKTKQRIVYERSLLQLFFMDCGKSYSSITVEHIKKWFHNHPKGWKNKTIDGYMGILRSFYTFCVKEGYIEKMPLKKTRWVKTAKMYWEVQQPIANQDNLEVINEYLLYLKDQKRNKKSVAESRIFLQSFFRQRKERFSSISEEDIQRWIQELGKSRKQKTLNCCVSSLRAFYRFCIRQGHMDRNPVKYHWENKSEKKYWELKGRLPNDENQDAINEFLVSMKVANFSKETIYQYRVFLWRYFKEKEEPFHSLTSGTILEWFLEQQNRLKESTMASYISFLSTFYAFCVEEGYVEKSPIKKQWYPRIPKAMPKYLEKKEIAKVRLQSEKEIFRNRVILEFLLATGCRVGEVHKLDKADVDLGNRSALVMGKGKKIRTVYFTERCALLLERYLESREDDAEAMFVSRWGNRLGVHRLHKIVAKIGEGAELPASFYPHRLRHTFATELLDKGADLLFIADALGHERIETTQVYAHLPERKLVSLYRKYMG